KLGATEAYDPASGTWSDRAALPTPRSGIAAAALGDRIYVVGGEQPSGTFAEVEAYRPGDDTWASAPYLPTPRHGLAAVAGPDGALYVLAGGPTPGGSASAANERFSPGGWRGGGDLGRCPRPRAI